MLVHVLPLNNQHFSEHDPQINLPPESFVDEPFIVAGQSREYLLQGLFLYLLLYCMLFTFPSR